jgi:hypothetical protein
LQTRPAIAKLDNGGFVIAFDWESGSGEVRVQRFTAAGNKTGAQFRANTFNTTDQARASVAGTANSGFIVTWKSINQDGSEDGVYGQRFTAAGVRRFAEFRANEHTQLDQDLPAVARWGNGFVIVWESEGQDAGGAGVFGKRFPQ